VRRRRLAIGVLAGLAAGAFALGAAMGDGRAPEIEVAATLPLPQLAGERIVAGVSGTSVPPRLEAAIHQGRLAGVILFAGNFPSRAAGQRLIARLQAIRRPLALRDPLLIMVDQEGGLVKRVGGAPTASAQEMGERGAAFSREQGRRTAANLHDLGVNVAPEVFIDAINEHKPDIVGFSAFLTTTMPMFKANINALEKAGIRDEVIVMVGGAPVTQEYADAVGADGYSADASSAVKMAKQLIQLRREKVLA